MSKRNPEYTFKKCVYRDNKYNQRLGRVGKSYMKKVLAPTKKKGRIAKGKGFMPASVGLLAGKSESKESISSKNNTPIEITPIFISVVKKLIGIPENMDKIKITKEQRRKIRQSLNMDNFKVIADKIHEEFKAKPTDQQLKEIIDNMHDALDESITGNGLLPVKKFYPAGSVKLLEKLYEHEHGGLLQTPSRAGLLRAPRRLN